MPPGTWHLYVRVCEELVEWWEPGRYQSGEGVSPLCAIGEPIAHVEHVLHELGHATSLRLPLDDTPSDRTIGTWSARDLLSQRIARHIYRNPGDHGPRETARTLRAEAMAWAVEHVCWRRLRMPFTVHDARRGAAEQGVPRSMVDACLGRPRFARSADRALAWLEMQRVAYAAGRRRRHDPSIRVE